MIFDMDYYGQKAMYEMQDNLQVSEGKASKDSMLYWMVFTHPEGGCITVYPQGKKEMVIAAENRDCN